MTSSSAPHHLKVEEAKQVKQKSLELLPEFRNVLGSTAEGVPDKTLLKFLHWKPDIKRASERFQKHIQWRKDNPFFFDEDPPLAASKDPNLKRVLESEVVVAPEGFVDKEGNTLLIGRFRNNNMEDGRTARDVVRMVLYTIDRVLEKEDAQINGVAVFHDMNGMSRKNIDPAIPKLLLRAIIGNWPLRIQGVYILNAPFFFHGIFRIVSIFMSSKLRQRIRFIRDISEIPVDVENLLVEHGGTREHNAKEWVQAQIERENNGTVDSLGIIPIPS